MNDVILIGAMGLLAFLSVWAVVFEHVMEQSMKIDRELEESRYEEDDE